jgi:hypothetical protein
VNTALGDATAEDGSEVDEEEEEGEDEDGRLQTKLSKDRSKKQGDVAAVVLAMLQVVSEEQVEEISQICR